MKIVIQGHLTRGKEVIQILESLGGKNNGYYGNNPELYYEVHGNLIVAMFTKNDNYKYYTLEEFKKEFPFKIGDGVIFPVKIGWASGKVTGLTYIEDQLKYEVDTRVGGYHYVEPHKLQLYPMKKERNITLTLEKAKEWYKKGGELKEVALQAYSEEELTKPDLPKSWEEFCRKYKTSCLSTRYANIPLKYDALIKLEQLRDCWRQGWEPIWDCSEKWCIRLWGNELSVGIATNISRFLTFPTKEMAEEFLKCFKDLIEKAGDLI